MRNPFWNTTDTDDPDAGSDMGKTKVLPVIPIIIPAKKKVVVPAKNNTGLVIAGALALMVLLSKK